MKRTLRIEVVRYSRSSTVITDEPALATHVTEAKARLEELLDVRAESQFAKTIPAELADAKPLHFISRFRLLTFIKHLFQR